MAAGLRYSFKYVDMRMSKRMKKLYKKRHCCEKMDLLGWTEVVYSELTVMSDNYYYWNELMRFYKKTMSNVITMQQFIQIVSCNTINGCSMVYLIKEICTSLKHKSVV